MPTYTSQPLLTPNIVYFYTRTNSQLPYLIQKYGCNPIIDDKKPRGYQLYRAGSAEYTGCARQWEI